MMSENRKLFGLNDIQAIRLMYLSCNEEILFPKHSPASDHCPHCNVRLDARGLEPVTELNLARIIRQLTQDPSGLLDIRFEVMDP